MHATGANQLGNQAVPQRRGPCAYQSDQRRNQRERISAGLGRFLRQQLSGYTRTPHLLSFALQRSRSREAAVHHGKLGAPAQANFRAARRAKINGRVLYPLAMVEQYEKANTITPENQ
jgi:hypothetical protein